MESITFEDADSQITDQMSGLVIDYVVRKGLELEFHFRNSKQVVVLQATEQYHIAHKRTDVRVALNGVSIGAEIGQF